MHLGPRTFDELSGEVVQNTAFVLSKHEPAEQGGVYYRLVDGKNCADKEQLFLSHINRNEDGNCICYPNVEQKNFEKIPGCPIGYWLSNKVYDIFESSNCINTYGDPRQGLATGDNNRFLRLWHEISFNKCLLNVENYLEAKTSGYKWFPCTKGGGFRKWNSIFETKGSICFPRVGTNTYALIAYLNSCVVQKMLGVISPTLDYHEGPLRKVPCISLDFKELGKIAANSISLSKSDWDAHETSWDFQRNELLSIDTSTYMENIDYKIEKHFEDTGEHISLSPAAPQLGSLEWRMEQYKTKWESKFMQLHKNEEELNSQFIDIYGLQDELTPDVPLNEITILQQGEINVTENDITWNEDVMTKQLISYAVGCMLGRYRLDKPGLHIAHPNPTDEEIAPYEYNGEQWEIDDDGIMPLMPNDCGFSDNASARFADFIRVALGNEEHVANLNYVEQCLGKTLEQYFVKDFWKDHKKMYQNRPIYWLFSSKKGAFQVIAYMHRMNAYTAERVRSKYLLPYIEHLEAEIDKLDARRAELSTRETKQLQTLQKQLDECREYHERLQVVAEQAISFDLDDGVVVNYAKFGDILQKIK